VPDVDQAEAAVQEPHSVPSAVLQAEVQGQAGQGEIGIKCSKEGEGQEEGWIDAEGQARCCSHEIDLQLAQDPAVLPLFEGQLYGNQNPMLPKKKDSSTESGEAADIAGIEQDQVPPL
jgi:hypothetical protein